MELETVEVQDIKQRGRWQQLGRLTIIGLKQRLCSGLSRVAAMLTRPTRAAAAAAQEHDMCMHLHWRLMGAAVQERVGTADRLMMMKTQLENCAVFKQVEGMLQDLSEAIEREADEADEDDEEDGRRASRRLEAGNRRRTARAALLARMRLDSSGARTATSAPGCGAVVCRMTAKELKGLVAAAGKSTAGITEMNELRALASKVIAKGSYPDWAPLTSAEGYLSGPAAVGTSSPMYKLDMGRWRLQASQWRMRPSKDETEWGWTGKPDYGYGQENCMTRSMPPRQWVYLVQMLVAVRLLLAQKGDWWRGRHRDAWLKHMLEGRLDTCDYGLADSDIAYIVRASDRAAADLFKTGRKQEITWVPYYCGMSADRPGAAMQDPVCCELCGGSKLVPGPLCMDCYKAAETHLAALHGAADGDQWGQEDELVDPRFMAQAATWFREESGYEAQHKSWRQLIRRFPKVDWQATVQSTLLVGCQLLALREGFTCGLRKVTARDGLSIKDAAVATMECIRADAHGIVQMVGEPTVLIWAGGGEGMRMDNEAGWCELSREKAKVCLRATALPFRPGERWPRREPDDDDDDDYNELWTPELAKHWTENPELQQIQGWADQMVASKCRLKDAVQGYQDRRRVQLLLERGAANGKIDERWDKLSTCRLQAAVHGYQDRRQVQLQLERDAVSEEIDERWDEPSAGVGKDEAKLAQVSDAANGVDKPWGPLWRRVWAVFVRKVQFLAGQLARKAALQEWQSVRSLCVPGWEPWTEYINFEARGGLTHEQDETRWLYFSELDRHNKIWDDWVRQDRKLHGKVQPYNAERLEDDRAAWAVAYPRYRRGRDFGWYRWGPGYVWYWATRDAAAGCQSRLGLIAEKLMHRCRIGWQDRALKGRVEALRQGHSRLRDEDKQLEDSKTKTDTCQALSERELWEAMHFSLMWGHLR
jgi:hypothetical protein